MSVPALLWWAQTAQPRENGAAGESTAVEVGRLGSWGRGVQGKSDPWMRGVRGMHLNSIPSDTYAVRTVIRALGSYCSPDYLESCTNAQRAPSLLLGDRATQRIIKGCEAASTRAS